MPPPHCSCLWRAECTSGGAAAATESGDCTPERRRWGELRRQRVPGRQATAQPDATEVKSMPQHPHLRRCGRPGRGWTGSSRAARAARGSPRSFQCRPAHRERRGAEAGRRSRKHVRMVGHGRGDARTARATERDGEQAATSGARGRRQRHKASTCVRRVPDWNCPSQVLPCKGEGMWHGVEWVKVDG